jgi:hypothetical protein
VCLNSFSSLTAMDRGGYNSSIISPHTVTTQEAALYLLSLAHMYSYVEQKVGPLIILLSLFCLASRRMHSSPTKSIPATVSSRAGRKGSPKRHQLFCQQTGECADHRYPRATSDPSVVVFQSLKPHKPPTSNPGRDSISYGVRTEDV